MTRFGIQDYEPAWLRGREAITTAHGQRLAGLVGRTLGHVWVLWDLETDEWFSDAPVLLDFGGEQVQIDHQKFDDLSITWNMTDPRRAIEDPDFQLAWRPEPTPQLQALIGAKVEGVELLEWLADRRDMAYGLADLAMAGEGLGREFLRRRVLAQARLRGGGRCHA